MHKNRYIWSFMYLQLQYTHTCDVLVKALSISSERKPTWKSLRREGFIDSCIGRPSLALASGTTIVRVSNNIINSLYLSLLSFSFSSLSNYFSVHWPHSLHPYGSFLYMDGDVPKGSFRFILYQLMVWRKKNSLSAAEQNAWGQSSICNSFNG